MLQLLVLGMIEGNRTSTRLLAELYNTRRFSLVSGKGAHTTRHSSIAERLTNIEPDYFKAIFEWLLAKYKTIITKSRLAKKVVSFDSTMVKISSALVDFGMRVGSVPANGPRQHQIKFTTQFHRGLPKGIKLFVNQTHLSEQVALRQAIKESTLQPGDIAVFDAGLTHRATFVAFDEADIQFVTKLKSNYRDEKISNHRQIAGRQADGLKFTRDDRVRLLGDGAKVVDHDFRIVEAVDQKSNKVYAFATNIWELSAMDIARIYKQRWQIEVLFRFLKQELSFSHMVNRSINGIEVQMYATLIAAIMLIVYKTKNKIETFGMAQLRFVDELVHAATRFMDKQPDLWHDG